MTSRRLHDKPGLPLPWAVIIPIALAAWAAIALIAAGALQLWSAW